MSIVPSDFLGRWSIVRTIQEHEAQAAATFEGVAEIIDAGNAWNYSETGTLTLQQGGAFQAERTYIWRPNGQTIDTYFSDGRYFHTIELSAKPKTSHWCDPDQYEVRYDFSAWPAWAAQWDVVGPRKNYRMVSAFRKAKL